MMRAVACALCAIVAIPAKAQDRPVTIALDPAIDRPSTTFEGWGTALAWFAEVTGGWPEADRTRLADLFYGPDGLGWTIARFNIGGGNPAGASGYLRPGAAVPGYWRPGTDGERWRAGDETGWDWSQDPNQRWWLGAVRTRVRQPILEAFSNSPPWFMTVSGRVSGAGRGTDDNLRPGAEAAFAAYLARIVDELQRREHVAFRTLSPVNEPGTDYWFRANRQEGSHWSPARQAAMVDAADAALRARGLATVVAAPDETNSRLFLVDWAAFPETTRARLGQLNVHSYATERQEEVRQAAAAAGKRLWMSEDDFASDPKPDDDAMAPALAFAAHVIGDLTRLRPAAWVFWQAVEDGDPQRADTGNWGLVKADLRAPAAGPHPIRITRKYWAMAQLSRYVRPGFRLLPVGDPDTVGALSPDTHTLAMVHTNIGRDPQRLAIPAGWRTSLIVTDATHDAACRTGTIVPPRSVATLVLTRKGAAAPCPAG